MEVLSDSSYASVVVVALAEVVIFVVSVAMEEVLVLLWPRLLLLCFA